MEPKIPLQYGYTLAGIFDGNGGSGLIAANYDVKEPYGLRKMGNPERLFLYDSNNNKSMVVNNPNGINVTFNHINHLIEVYESFDFE